VDKQKSERRPPEDTTADRRPKYWIRSQQQVPSGRQQAHQPSRLTAAGSLCGVETSRPDPPADGTSPFANRSTADRKKSSRGHDDERDRRRRPACIRRCLFSSRHPSRIVRATHLYAAYAEADRSAAGLLDGVLARHRRRRLAVADLARRTALGRRALALGRAADQAVDVGRRARRALVAKLGLDRRRVDAAGMEDWREVGRRISGDVRTSASAITDGRQPKRTFADRVQRLHVLGLLLK